MRDLTALQDVLDRAEVDPAVRALRPDYRALLLTVEQVGPACHTGEHSCFHDVLQETS